MPAKRFFKISENLDKLKEMIALGEEIIAKKFGAEKTKKRVELDNVSEKEFAEYTESESCETALQSASCSSAETSEQVPPKAPNNFRQNADIPYKTKNNNHNKKSSSGDDENSREYFLSALKKNICYGELCAERSNEQKIIDDMLEIMLDVICSKREKVRVNGDNKAKSAVADVFFKLKKEHFLSVLNALRSNPNPIFNRRGYIITVLYNSLVNVTYPGQTSSPKVTCIAKSQKTSFDTDKLRAAVMANYARK